MKQLLASMAVMCISIITLAADQPFQASLTPDIAVHPKTAVIEGLTLSIWGENQQHGLALGFINGTSGKSGGFSWGLVGYGDSYNGVQWSIANYMKGDFAGWQGGCVNFTGGRFTGLQSGWVNYAVTLSGLQLGIVNIADKTDEAVQIGLVNIINENKDWFGGLPNAVAPGMIIVNWRF